MSTYTIPRSTDLCHTLIVFMLISLYIFKSKMDNTKEILNNFNNLIILIRLSRYSLNFALIHHFYAIFCPSPHFVSFSHAFIITQCLLSKYSKYTLFLSSRRKFHLLSHYLYLHNSRNHSSTKHHLLLCKLL